MNRALATDTRPHPAPIGTVVRTLTPATAPRIGEEWPRLWFAVQRLPWSVLVIVPADVGVSSLQAARALAEAGALYRPSLVHCIDAVGVSPATATTITDAIRAASTRGEQSIVAVDCPLSNHAAIHIARAADAAVLLVPLGAAALAAASRCIEMIGRQRFMGSITINASAGAARR